MTGIKLDTMPLQKEPSTLPAKGTCASAAVIFERYNIE